MSDIRRKMKARMNISLNSASFATTDRKPSGLISRNSPGSVTRPRTRLRVPEIILISPVNSPGPCVMISRSPVNVGCTISRRPERSTKKGTPVSSGSNKISLRFTLRRLPPERRRSICEGVKAGNACVFASSALGMGKEDISFSPSYPHWMISLTVWLHQDSSEGDATCFDSLLQLHDQQCHVIVLRRTCSEFISGAENRVQHIHRGSFAAALICGAEHSLLAPFFIVHSHCFADSVRVSNQ